MTGVSAFEKFTYVAIFVDRIFFAKRVDPKAVSFAMLHRKLFARAKELAGHGGLEPGQPPSI